jgi:hypothetical protein
VKEAREFFPKDPINISFTAASTTFQLVNSSSGPKTYVFNASANCHIRRGYSDVSAATTNDLRLPLNIQVFLSLAPNEGVRVIRGTADGVLQIGDLAL